MFHGTADPLIPFEWGARTHAALAAACGGDVQFVALERMRHEVVAEELLQLEAMVMGAVASPQ